MNSQKLNKTIKASIIVFSFLISNLLFAQNTGDFFTPIDHQSVNLSDSEQKKLENLEKNPAYKDIQFVDIGELHNFITNGEMTFNIPKTEKKYEARVKEYEYNSPDDYIWKGNLQDQYGSIVVFCEKGRTFGHIVIENKEYEFQTFNDKNIFIKFNMEYLNKSRCKTIKVPKNIKPKENPLDTIDNKNRTCTGNVRVLVLYTPAAQNAVSNISNTATLAINSVQDALDNSAISWGDLHISQAGLEFYNFTETEDPEEDLANLRTSSEAHDLRNQNQADLVILLTHGNYYPILGKAYLGPNEYSAYSIVQAVEATSGYTFAHEVGHLFGCLHQEGANDGVTGEFEYPHRFTTGWWFWEQKWRTILQTNAWSSYTRIQNYSNPDVEHDNKATGTSTHDNARKLEEESCTVENFRPYNPPPSVNINGPSKGNNSGTYTWTAYGSGGQSPYTYLWKYSLDGTNYNSTFGTGQSVTAQLPLDNDLYLKVIMTDDNQEQAIDYHVTLNLSGQPEPKKGNTASNNKNNPTLISKNENDKPKTRALYPNPADENTTVNYKLEQSGKVHISIVNSFGKVVQTFEIKHESAGVFYKKLQTVNLKNGAYLVKISYGDNHEIHNLIIQ